MQAGKFAVKAQRFLASEEFVEVRVFGQKADHGPAVHTPAVAPKNFHAAARRPKQTENNLQRRALAGAVWSEQSVNLAGFHFEVEIAQRDDRLSPERDRKNFG